MAYRHPTRLFLSIALALFVAVALVKIGNASEGEAFSGTPKVDEDLGASRAGLSTDSETLVKEEEAIKIDGLNVAQIKELRERAEKHAFQAEVNRMMKLIINSLYRNKDIFLRELISNASDALDKIRLLSLTEQGALDATEELSIRIRADKDNHLLHIIDTGVGMTKEDLLNNLGTIAKSGTAEFISKLTSTDVKNDEAGDLIGQFGVGFYSAFLVADNVIVTTKHNEDKQYIWESDASSFSVVEDPRGPTLKRGTQITLKLKEEAWDFLEQDTLRNLVKKYSQFINFPIYLWASKTEMVDEVIEHDAPEKEKKEDGTDEEAAVEEEEEKTEKTKKVEKTTWDWEFLNDAKPIWMRKPADIQDEEYDDFYKSLTKEKDKPLARTHFVAEGEVSFKALLYIPQSLPSEAFQLYGKKTDNIKLYVRRVFITDDFSDMMPSYLAFIRGIVDSDDLPLNVSRENLQQHKLLKVIKKKLVRKVLDMMKKIEGDDYDKFWKEFGTHIKLGVIEDTANRSRLSKLLRFYSSADEKKHTSLADYVSRMKEKQQNIYYLGGASLKEIKESPFVERLLDKGYEVLYLPEPVDEYCLSALPEFDGKKFQNAAREGLKLEEDSEAAKQYKEEQKTKFQPLLDWLRDEALSQWVSKAELSERLQSSPCALVANAWGWTGNMERLAVANAHQKESMMDFQLNQKKVLEINPRHPIIKDLLRRINEDKKDETAIDMAKMMFRTATLRSGYMLQDTFEFADSIERMMRITMGVSPDEPVEPEPEFSADEAKEKASDEDEEVSGDGEDESSRSEHTEL